MGSNIRCCPTKAPPQAGPAPIIQPGKPSDTAACAGLIFPLATGSLQHISVNWGGSRNSGARCHAGIDLFSQGAKKVVAIADGVVTGTMTNFLTCTCTGSSVAAGAVMVYHASIDKTVNYGEITGSSIQVKQGQRVTQGQFLGTAGACCMLHFELYSGSQWPNLHWYPSTGNKATDPDGCTKTSLSTKPAGILDPRPLINCLKPAGASLLVDAGVGSEQAVISKVKPVVKKPVAVKGGIPGGYVALIVIVMALVVACVGVIVVCYVRQRRAAASHDAVVVVNAAFGLAGTASGDVSNDAGSGVMSARTGMMMTMRAEETTTTLPNETFEMSRNVSSSTPVGVNSGASFAASSSKGKLPTSASSTYQCGVCANTYADAHDLAQHVLLRHP